MANSEYQDMDDTAFASSHENSLYDLSASTSTLTIEEVEIEHTTDRESYQLQPRQPLSIQQHNNYHTNSNSNSNALKANKSKLGSTAANSEHTGTELEAASFIERVYARSVLISQALGATYAESTYVDVETLERESLLGVAIDDGSRPKFGTWDGVMARCILNIFGVIMFLRVGFMVGQCGIIDSILIILIASVVTILTTLSMSAICTNGVILGGGAYFFISRALGPSLGGAIGIIFCIGNMMAVSLYLIGFAETIHENIYDEAGWHFFVGDRNNVRVWANITLIFVLMLAIFGLNYVVKTQLMLLLFIIISLILFFVGSLYKTEYGDDGEQTVFGFAGWRNGNFHDNLSADYEGYSFWSIFAIFFPAVTGIMAGANISGDLRNPHIDIPKGTLWAIGVSSIAYILLATVTGAVVSRSELKDNNLIMASICVWDYLILIGIYAATLSSAIASLVGAPRILQAIVHDLDQQCFGGALFLFEKQNVSGDPINGYLLTFLVAFGCNVIGDLNAVAPLISQFFMLTYLIINLAAFYLEIAPKSDSWNPSFLYFNKYTAGVGCVSCAYVMFVMSWLYALLALLPTIVIYVWIEYRNPSVHWQTTKQFKILCCCK